MKTIQCRVVVDKVWHSQECRLLAAGDVVEFPAEVVDYQGKTVPFKVGDAFEVIEPEVKAKKPKADDLV